MTRKKINILLVVKSNYHAVLINHELKSRYGYYNEFFPVSSVWLDSIVHVLKYEEPYKSNLNARKFAEKVNNFFQNKFGNMVYHKSDEKYINKLMDSNLNNLKQNTSFEQIKDQIKFTNSALHKLKRMDIVAPEGAHREEMDFWVNQREKDYYMGNLI